MTYTIGQLTWDFLNIAFSSTLPLDNSGREQWNVLRVLWSRAQHEEYRPPQATWRTPYKDRPNGLPKLGTINKWPGQITVSVGWPQYQRDPFLDGRAGPSAKTTEALKRFEVHARKMVDTIAARTKLPLVYVPADDPQEKTERFARIRVVAEDNTFMHNDYKFYSGEYYTHTWDVTLLAAGFIGAIEFTPFARAQVDGLILPEVDNHIGMAICRIRSGTPDEMLATLIGECLVRSLGLPEMSKLKESALIGHWNALEDPESKTLALDGKSAGRPPMIPRTDREIPTTEFNRRIASEGLAQYDAAMLQLLYCGVIQPGMDKLAAAAALLAHQECFGSFIEEREPNGDQN